MQTLKNRISTALGLLVATMALSACQTGNLTPDQWNARTNALSAFSNSAYQFTESQRPVHIQGAPQKQRIVCTDTQCFVVNQ